MEESKNSNSEEFTAGDNFFGQMIEAEETFGVLLKQLPNESEIPDLLIDMTQVGLSRGLQFQQIKPGNTIAKDFYAEKLVNVKATGTYNQIASFVSDIAALQRIINVDNFKLTKTVSIVQSSLRLIIKDMELPENVSSHSTQATLLS